MSGTREEHYKDEREWSGHCPYCGGHATAVFKYDDGIDVGSSCYISCGWMRVYGEPEKPGARFILPGDPGSHDKLEDYDPWEGDE
jgi:hypothetical protein